MSGDVKDLFLRHREAQDKYVYFQLAAAAAALAFAVQKTDTLTITWPMLPLALAAASWALSFFCGCKTIAWVQTALYANVALLQLKEGTHPDQPPAPIEQAAAIQGVRNALNENAERAYTYGRWQFRLLVAGGLLFLGWHVFQMYIRTCAT